MKVLRPSRRRLQRGERIEVIWDDHCSHHGWDRDDRVKPKLERIHSLGYFVKQTKSTLLLAQSVDEEHGSQAGTGERLNIGKALILRIRRFGIVSTPEPG